MIAKLVAVVVLTLNGAVLVDDAPKKPDEATMKDLDSIRGTWNLTSAKRAGKAVDVDQERQIPKQFIFADGDKITVKAAGREKKGTYKLEASQKPKALTLTSGDDGSETIAARYELEGDTLRVCVNESNLSERPNEIDSKEGSRQVLAVFTRDKK